MVRHFFVAALVDVCAHIVVEWLLRALLGR
jgi:hypothetical protein